MTASLAVLFRIIAIVLFLVGALVILLVSAPDPKLFPVLLLVGLASWALGTVVP